VNHPTELLENADLLGQQNIPIKIEIRENEGVLLVNLLVPRSAFERATKSLFKWAM